MSTQVRETGHPTGEQFRSAGMCCIFVCLQTVFSAEHRNLTSLFPSNSFSRKHYLMSLKFFIAFTFIHGSNFHFFFPFDKEIMLVFQAVEFVKKVNLSLSTPWVGRDGVVGIATRCGLEVRVRILIEARFSARVLGHAQLPVRWVPGILPGRKAAGAWP
jgi:hypothetical protein